MDLFKKKDDMSVEWHRVKSKAIHHTRHNALPDLINKRRPEEPDTIKKYREDNYRNITFSDIVKYISKVNRFLYSSDYEINVRNQNVQAYINGNSFVVNNESSDLEKYFFEYILKCAIESPNDVLIVFPYNNVNYLIPPNYSEEDGGVSANELVPAEIKIIGIEDIVEKTFDKFIFKSGFPKNAYGDILFEVDIDNYYLLVPTSDRDDKGSIIYTKEIWFEHKYISNGEKMLPIHTLGGIISKSDNGEYFESILKGYFEYADEFISSFSDSQAVRIRHLHPKEVLIAQPCGACNGGTKNIKGGCKVCHGTGEVYATSPYSSLVRPTDNNGIVTNAPVLEYITPPSDNLELNLRTPFDLLKMGQRAIGLDLLVDDNESSLAMEKRLEDLEDSLSLASNVIFGAIEKTLHILHYLININPSESDLPIVVRPSSYKLLTKEDLRSISENSVLGDRFRSKYEYYKRIIKNAFELKVREFYMRYSPLSLFTLEEFESHIASGVYGQIDVLKRDSSEMYIKEILERSPNASYDQVKQLLDERYSIQAI